MANEPIAVLGSGMAGLGACHVLRSAGASFTCFDKNSYYGGHSRSIAYESGFVFDEGVHISFTRNEHVKSLFADGVQGKFEERRFAIDNYWRGHRLAQPVQCNLRGLPTDLIVKIISDFTNRHATDSGSPMPLNREIRTYADWLYNVYGKTFADTFPMTYGKKYHTTTMDKLTTDWIGPRMYQPTLEDLLRGAIDRPTAEAHYIQTYRYPSSGGFVSYLHLLAKDLDIRLGHALVGIDPSEKLLRFSNGTTFGYSRAISSIPLTALIPMIDDVPPSVSEACHKLAFSTAILFNIGLTRDDISDAATTYFYDEDIIISRLNLPHLFSPNNAPPEYGAIQAEVYFSDKYSPMPANPKSLADTVLRDLKRTGFIRDDDRILMFDIVINRYANIIYDMDRASAVSTVHSYLDEIGISYCGRYGKWDHSWTDEAFVSGEESARDVLGDA